MFVYNMRALSLYYEGVTIIHVEVEVGEMFGLKFYYYHGEFAIWISYIPSLLLSVIPLLYHIMFACMEPKHTSMAPFY